MRRFPQLACFMLGAGVISACVSKPLAVHEKPLAVHEKPLAGNKIKPTSVQDVFAQQDVTVVAHRGCWREAPENSIAAINACARLGVDMVELDVRETKDGVLVLLHDETLDRTTNLSGRLEGFTYAQLSSAKLREGAGGQTAAYTEHGIPTLAEALQAAEGQMLINLDIKKEFLHDRALNIIERYGAENRVLFKMLAAPESDRLRAALFHGRVAFMPIIVQCPPEPISDTYCSSDLLFAVERFQPFQPVAIEVVFQDDSFIEGVVTKLAAKGFEIWVNTLYRSISGGRHDDDAVERPNDVWGNLINEGVTIFQTDRPARLIDYLKMRGVR